MANQFNPATPDPKADKPAKPLRRHEIVKAEAWAAITAKYKSTDAKGREKLNKEVRYDVDVTDLRDFVVGIVHEKFGRGEGAFYEVEAHGAANHRTIWKWSVGETQNPRLSKMRQVALICDYDLKFVPRGGK